MIWNWYKQHKSKEFWEFVHDLRKKLDIHITLGNGYFVPKPCNNIKHGGVHFHIPRFVSEEDFMFFVKEFKRENTFNFFAHKYQFKRN